MTTFHDISQDHRATYRITQPGTHVFFFKNRPGTITFTLAKEGARAFLFGIYDLRSKERCSVRTMQHHKAPHTASTMLVKSILADHAFFSFDGLIRIDRTAKGTEAHLTNRNLVLSEKAVVHSRPHLEIFPDDVRCTHAATTSFVSPTEHHYLTTRGINAGAAQSLLVDGFRRDLYNQLMRLVATH